jgi:hypothetical protein
MMMGWSGSGAGGKSPTLGRLHGLLLLALGGIVLTVLLRQTQYHRARLAAEVLGIVLGGAATVLVFGLTRPSPQVVTRAYVLLSRHTRRLLIAGMTSLFGFAVATAAVHRVAPQLRQVPALGGIVTLDWVLSLSMLAIAGSTLLCVGLMAMVARPTAAAAGAAPDGATLERLWAAANGDDGQALRACFAAGKQGESLMRTWAACAGPMGSSQVLLVRSAARAGRTWSEWYARRHDDGAVHRWVVVANEQAGRLGDDCAFYQFLAGPLPGSGARWEQGDAGAALPSPQLLARESPG